jgi:hypothetical protein
VGVGVILVTAAQAVLALITMLAGPRGEQAACALAQLLDRREHLPGTSGRACAGARADRLRRRGTAVVGDEAAELEE